MGFVELKKSTYHVPLSIAQYRFLDTMQSSRFCVHVIVRPPTQTTALQTSQSVAH